MAGKKQRVKTSSVSIVKSNSHSKTEGSDKGGAAQGKKQITKRSSASLTSAKQTLAKQTLAKQILPDEAAKPVSSRIVKADKKSVKQKASATETKHAERSPTAKYDSLKDTSEIVVSKEIVNQVIGQEEGVRVIRKAASQRRHVFLIGEPGTGKSMLGLALAELLPKEKLVDIISFFNPNDDNQPLIRTVSAGQGRDLVAKSRIESMSVFKNQNLFMILLLIAFLVMSFWSWGYFTEKYGATVAAIMTTGAMLGLFVFAGILMFSMSVGRKGPGGKDSNSPKVIVDNFKKEQAPFYDATGAHAGALLGDVLHDPFQSGGLGTPAHERVVAGMIHKANKGVLFIDEIATLQPHTQQELLSALQERKYSITGQSERSAGAMVRTEAVPCDFVLVAAGNLETVKHMHPALRSRIKGYGYEVYMNETMPDTAENRWRLAVFIAQEVVKDQKIPHFAKDAVDEIIEEARRRANRKNHLTIRLRDLGGLVRAAGDLAKDEKANLVTKDHIVRAKKIARSLEQQIADKFISRKKEYEVIITSGKMVGRVNGLAVIGGEASYSGIILPIESQVTSGGKEKEFIATGKLGEIAKEAVKNVTAIIKKYFGQDIKDYDVYVQFLQTYEGVEGDSASIAVATSIISALKKIPVKQEVAMTGSLSVRGEVLPVGGVSAKVEGAIDAGIKKILVPKSNMHDIIIDPDRLKQITIVPVETISQVLKEALDFEGNKSVLKAIKQINGN